jgi:hypothetical protein
MGAVDVQDPDQLLVARVLGRFLVVERLSDGYAMAGLNRLIEMLFSSPALKEPLCADGKGCFFSRGAAAVFTGRFMSRPAEGEEEEEEEEAEEDGDRERRVLFQPEANQLRDLIFNEIQRGNGESVAVLLDTFEQLLDLFPMTGTVLLYRREWSLSQ